MKKWIIFLSACLVSCSAFSMHRYAEKFCKDPHYSCVVVKNHQDWEDFAASDEEIDILRRLNRINIALRPGMIVAIPKNLSRLTIYDFSPFPRYIDTKGEKTIYVSQKDLAWGAYDDEGELIWWGPISPGMAGCKGKTGSCETPSGAFRIIRKQDIDCISTAFPRRADGNNGGAAMPYCMHFYRGYALHGSDDVPGYRASHGCVRMFIEDARWLNEEFVSTAEDDGRGTRVILDSP